MDINDCPEGPVTAEFVGGPHDGYRLTVPCLRKFLAYPAASCAHESTDTDRLVRYRLDEGCLDGDGRLAAPVARYVYQQPVRASH